MLKTSRQEFKNTLSSFSLGKEPVILIHSGLLKFGLIEKGAAGLFSVIENWAGKNATIVMPAFTFSYPSKKKWHLTSTETETGALTEFFRKMVGVKRSLHPIHSLCAMGPRAEEIASAFCVSSFGKGSAYDKLFEFDAWNFSIGTEFEGGATYLHYTEEDLEVPYRFYKDFPGEVFDATEKKVDTTFSMYARVITDQYQYINIWGPLWEELNRENVFQIEKLNGANFYLSRMRRGHEVFKKLLLKDPFYPAIMKSKN